MKKGAITFSIMIGCLVVGILAALLAVRISHMAFGMYVWPFVACVSVFLFSSIGFFMTEGNKEVLYGACSVASLACGIVQLAIFF